MEETQTSPATPEQLLQALAAQLAQRRLQRGKSRVNRAAILVAAVLFIVIAAAGSLFFLGQILSDMRSASKKPEGEAPATPHLIKERPASGAFLEKIGASQELRPPAVEPTATTTASGKF